MYKYIDKYYSDIHMTKYQSELVLVKSIPLSTINHYIIPPANPVTHRLSVQPVYFFYKRTAPFLPAFEKFIDLREFSLMQESYSSYCNSTPSLNVIVFLNKIPPYLSWVYIFFNLTIFIMVLNTLFGTEILFLALLLSQVITFCEYNGIFLSNSSIFSYF